MSLQAVERLRHLLQGRVSTEVRSNDPDDGDGSADIFLCHSAILGSYALWDGPRYAAEVVLRRRRTAERQRPILIFGLHSIERVRAQPEGKILGFPVVQYLSYDATNEEIARALRIAFDARDHPVPDDAVACDTLALLGVLGAVRHLLENRRVLLWSKLSAAQKNARQLFDGTADAPAFCTPVQRRMLERLWSYEQLCAARLDDGSRIRSIRAEMDRLESLWEESRGAVGGDENVLAEYAARAPRLSTIFEQMIESTGTLIDDLTALEGALKRGG